MCNTDSVIINIFSRLNSIGHNLMKINFVFEVDCVIFDVWWHFIKAVPGKTGQTRLDLVFSTSLKRRHLVIKRLIFHYFRTSSTSFIGGNKIFFMTKIRNFRDVQNTTNVLQISKSIARHVWSVLDGLIQIDKISSILRSTSMNENSVEEKL